jgi:thymidylate synthase (FAD)
LYFPVLDKGFISLIDYMGTDEDVENAARVSYSNKGRKLSDTETLIRYLKRNKHDSPEEMVSMKFHLKMPLLVIQQLLRHRTAKINQASFRYTEVQDELQQTLPDEWRLQSKDNKQGSSGTLGLWPEEWEKMESYSSMFEYRKSPSGKLYETEIHKTPGEYLSTREKEFQDLAMSLYDTRLELGVAKEQARKDIPVSTYSTLYWKCDLRNILHLLSLRCDSHAQIETRLYANMMAGMVKRLCPITFQAWLDYSFCSRSFSRLELDFLSLIALYSGSWEEKRKEYEYANGFGSLERSKLSKREYNEFWTKLNTPEIPSFELDLSTAKTIEEIQRS